MTAETLAPGNALLPLSQALLLPRIAIESTAPVIDGGEFAVKAVVGQRVNVTSKVFADGHDKLAVLVRWRALQEESWHSVVMTDVGNNGWEGLLPSRPKAPTNTASKPGSTRSPAFATNCARSTRPGCR